MRNRLWLICLLCALMCAVCFTASAKETYGYMGFAYEPDETDNTATIKGYYEFSTEDLVIPAYMEEEFLVDTIGLTAFAYNNSLKTVVIPETVVKIDTSAFAYCENLASVTIPEGVEEIMDFVFYECPSLTSVTIPDSITLICAASFCNCASLQEINVSENNQNYQVVNGLLLNKKGTVLQCCPGSFTEVTIPEGVTKLDDRAFFGCKNLTTVVIPEGVTSIGDWEFFDCKALTSVTIPASVTKIYNNAFMLLENVTLTVVENSYAHTFAVEHNIPFVFAE